MFGIACGERGWRERMGWPHGAPGEFVLLRNDRILGHLFLGFSCMNTSTRQKWEFRDNIRVNLLKLQAQDLV